MSDTQAFYIYVLNINSRVWLLALVVLVGSPVAQILILIEFSFNKHIDQKVCPLCPDTHEYKSTELILSWLKMDVFWVHCNPKTIMHHLVSHIIVFLEYLVSINTHPILSGV